MASVVCIIYYQKYTFYILDWYMYSYGKCEVTLTRQYRYVSVDNVQIADKKGVPTCE